MRKISVLVSSIGHGGAEKIMARIAALIAENREINVELVVVSHINGDIRRSLPSRLNVIELNAKHYMSTLKPLYEAIISKKFFPAVGLAFKTVFWLWKKTLAPIVGYIKSSRPDIIFTTHYNSVTILANWLAGSPAQIVITEHTVLSRHFSSQIWFIRKFFPAICRFFYPKAKQVIGVSKYVADDLVSYLGISKDKVCYIYNPIVGRVLDKMASENSTHLWLDRHAPVFMAIGRMSPEKDFHTLLKAFSLFRGRMEARLMMIGDGPLMHCLREYTDELNVSDFVDWLGFVDNPIPYIKMVDVLVISSRYEGLPTVVIEALSVGTTIVAADCPGGIREILGDDEYGYLVPVDSPEEMAEMMMFALDNPYPKEKLRSRAEIFSDGNSLQSYLCLIDDLLTEPRR